MASIRTLRRRLLRWQRYGRRIRLGHGLAGVAFPSGYTRALIAHDREWIRRRSCPLCGYPMCLGDCFELAGPPPRPVVTVTMAELS